MSYLTIVDGPGTGTSFELTGVEQVLGRDPSADIHFNSLHVSRRHAKVWGRGGQYYIQDLSSQNGTFVNGLPIDLHVLNPGDEIVVGEVVLTFAENLESAPVVQAPLTSQGSLPGDLSLTDTLQSVPEQSARFLQADERWKRVPDDLRGLAVVNEVARMAASMTSMDDFLGKVMDLILAVTKAQRGVLLQYKPRTNTLSIRVIRNPKSDDLPEAAFSKTIVRYVMKRGTGILSQDAKEDERFSASATVRELGLQSTICVPLRFRNRILGVIHIDSVSEKPLGQKDLLLVHAIANQTAMVLETTRLQETQRREDLAFRRRLQADSLIIGKSRRMKEIVDIIRVVAPTDSTVLVRGESGTGKEVVARTIHRQSLRRDKPMTVVNCAALSPTVLESELFGHEKGAFTGAHQRRLGRFELANGSTIFLDEIGELPLELQAKLLRVLQEQEFERVGGEETIKVDVRILASTNRDLQAGIRQGTFREDLYFRLKVIELVLPPLRERMEDVPQLAQHFIQSYAGEMGRPVPRLSPPAQDALVRYTWPGNVRELKNAMERAVVLASGDTITDKDMPQIGAAAEPRGDSEGNMSLKMAEERQIRRVLRLTDWNKSHAAKMLGISRSRLDRKLKDYGITRGSTYRDE